MTEQKKAQFSGKEKDQQMDEHLRERYYSEDGRKSRKRNVRIGFCITLVILLLASFLNWGIITGWGNVDIDRITISGNDGAEFSALLYRPANATDATPAPGVIMWHGNAGNARNHESWAMEFARRGFVVMAPDLYGSGNSEAYFTGYLPDVEGPEAMGAATSEESLIKEADLFAQYFLTLPYVDKENWLSTGHSMGGVPSFAMGAMYDAKGILVAAGTSAWNFANASLDTCSELYRPYLEAWKNYTKNTVVMMGDVEHSATLDPEQMNKSIQTKTLPTLLKYPGHEADTEIIPNHEYGSFEDGNGYITLVEPNRIHEAAFVSRTTIGNLLKYGQITVSDNLPNYIDSEDQIWMYKDYVGLFGIYAFGAFICALALLLIEEVPAFNKVRRPVARNIGLRGVGMAISLILGVVFPYIVLKTDALGIIGGANGLNLWNLGFHINYSNLAFGTLIGLNILGFCGFLIYYFAEGKKVHLKAADLGLTPEGYERLENGGSRAKAVILWIIRTALLAAVVVGIAWSYMQFQSFLLGTDFYAWFFGVKDIPVSKMGYYWKYILVYIICFAIASLTLNVERRLPTTGNETLDTILQIIFNIVMGTIVIVIVVAVKWHLQSIGSPADKGLIWSMGVDTQRLWGMPVGMAVGIGGSTFLYRKTGNAWLSAILMGTVACLCCVLYGGTRFHYLTFLA